MLQGITRFAIAGTGDILIVAVPLMVVRGSTSAPVMDSLSAGGFRTNVGVVARNRNAGPQVRTGRYATDRLGYLRRGDAERGRAQHRRRPRHETAAIPIRHPGVLQCVWNTSPAMARSMISEDGKTGLIVAGVSGGDRRTARSATRASCCPLLHDREGVTVKAGVGGHLHRGNRPEQARPSHHGSDRAAVELCRTVWVFGGLLAAAVPLAVGGFAIVGSMAVMRGLGSLTEASIFALNLIMAWAGTGHRLYVPIVSRYRDEPADAPDATKGTGVDAWRLCDVWCCPLRPLFLLPMATMTTSLRCNF